MCLLPGFARLNGVWFLDISAGRKRIMQYQADYALGIGGIGISSE
jgi:hypothetical protein